MNHRKNILFGALGLVFVVTFCLPSLYVRADGRRFEDSRRVDDARRIEERRRVEEEQRRLAEERRFHPAPVYVPAPVEIVDAAPPPPSPGISLVIPISFH